MIDYIQGNRFKGLTPIHYAPPYGQGGMTRNTFGSNDYRFLKNTLDVNGLKSSDIIYTHTFFVDSLFKILEKLEYRQFTVVTHNSDTNIDFVPPDNVYWYTTNVNIRYKSIQSIPIGIENDFWLKDKRNLMEAKLVNPKKYRNLVYMNHSIATNPAKRQKPYTLFSGEKWVTTNIGSNRQGFDNYIDNVYNHPFVICPEGNGIDTHRVWECLYMNTIPIVLKNINNSFYSDLPILFLNNWEDINEKFLYDTFMEFNTKEWNIEKLTFEYWRKLIKDSKP